MSSRARPRWVSNSRKTLVMHRTLPPREYMFGVTATNPAAAIRADVDSLSAAYPIASCTTTTPGHGPWPSGTLISASIGPAGVLISIVVTSSIYGTQSKPETLHLHGDAAVCPIRGGRARGDRRAGVDDRLRLDRAPAAWDLCCRARAGRVTGQASHSPVAVRSDGGNGARSGDRQCARRIGYRARRGSRPGQLRCGGAVAAAAHPRGSPPAGDRDGRAPDAADHCRCPRGGLHRRARRV